MPLPIIGPIEMSDVFCGPFANTQTHHILCTQHDNFRNGRHKIKMRTEIRKKMPSKCSVENESEWHSFCGYTMASNAWNDYIIDINTESKHNKHNKARAYTKSAFVIDLFTDVRTYICEPELVFCTCFYCQSVNECVCVYTPISESIRQSL